MCKFCKAVVEVFGEVYLRYCPVVVDQRGKRVS
jgi:hypothetical protein